MLNLRLIHLLIESIFSIFFILACSTSSVIADSMHSKNPLDNNKHEIYSLPNNIDELSISELSALKNTYTNTLKSNRNIKKSLISYEQELLNSLLNYDDVRLNISEVILDLAEEYNATGKYKKKLLGYADTFKNKIGPSRDSVNTLDKYKTYGTHFSVAYISLLYAFKENKTFYNQYIQDINNPESTLGIYKLKLDSSYKKVESAHKKYAHSQKVMIIKQLITQLNIEIMYRKTNLYSQNRINHNQ